MAEGFQPYHVPQQTRRDKLRVVYDPIPPPLISPDFIAAAKEEGVNFMSFVGGLGANHVYADPHLTVHLNPSFSIQDINSAPFVYTGGGSAAAAGGQSLSLSLSSHHNNLNLQRYENEGNLVDGGDGGGGAAAELSKSSVPLGPFTGYASVLRGSRFLKPAQQLLEELCDVGVYADKKDVDSSLLDPPPLESLSGSEIGKDSVNGVEQAGKKSRLLSMLDEVYRRYKQCYHQMQVSVAAFESVAGLTNAAPFANLALKAMSKHFRCLKNAITDQLQFTSKPHGKISSDRDEARPDNPGQSSYGHRPFHGFVDQPVWRPQRGLPERAVTVLRAWLFEHFLHPYPTDTDKIMLAKQTGLSRNQVSNWFINARVRLWKPMVEEIHMLETRQALKPSQAEDHPNDHRLPTSCSIECENTSTSSQRIEFPLKRGREDPNEAMGQMKMTYDTLLHHNHSHIGGGGGGGSVSLTLGLHQNGVGLTDSYPLNAARRFGLDLEGEGYVVSGFAAQNHQFG